MIELKKFGEVCDFVRGPFGGSLKKSCFVEEGYAVYEQQHAIYNQFSDIRYFVTEDKFNEMKRFELKPNDLIMSCSGTMGKVAIVPEGIKQGIINQALLKLTPKDFLDIEYLKYWMSRTSIEDNNINMINKNKYWDSYSKFFIYGDKKGEMNDDIRISNKVGMAYGTLTDVAYVKDKINNIEFMLTATILVNDNDTFNDDIYEYDSKGIPFLSALGRQVLKYERKKLTFN